MIESINKILNALNKFEDKEFILEEWAYSIIDKCCETAFEWQETNEQNQQIAKVKELIKF